MSLRVFMCRLELRSDTPAVLKRALREAEKTEGVVRKKRRVSSQPIAESSITNAAPEPPASSATHPKETADIVSSTVARSSRKASKAAKPSPKQVDEQSEEEDEEEEEAAGQIDRQNGTAKKRRRRGKRSRKKKTDRASDTEHAEAQADVAQALAVASTPEQPTRSMQPRIVQPSQTVVASDQPVQTRVKKISESEGARVALPLQTAATTPDQPSRSKSSKGKGGHAILKVHAETEQQQNRRLRLPVPLNQADSGSWRPLEGPPQVGQKLAFKVWCMGSLCCYRTRFSSIHYSHIN